MARRGLNATLSYQRGGGLHTYRIRAGVIAHGVQMIATEDAARQVRAYYPHRTAMQQFSVVVLLRNWDERRDFTSWLDGYASFVINPDLVHDQFPWMTVDIPSREFRQPGVPLSGYEWGAHTGQMMFTPKVVFEAATSPGQKHRPDISRVINSWSAFTSDKAIQYFYPFGSQLAGQQPGNYSKIQYLGDIGLVDQSKPGPLGPLPASKQRQLAP
jgi:hypothetical protein